MVTIIVAGAAGRMGTTMLKLINNDSRFKLAGAYEREGHPTVNKSVGELIGISALKLAVETVDTASFENGDVLIDFTAPQATLANLDYACKNGTSMVIGTTGMNEEQLARIKDAAQEIAIVMSGNMSVGINVLLSLVAKAAQALGDSFDVEIIEAHHRYKKDAPSGTAKMLATSIADALERDLTKTGIYGRQGMTGERKAEEIGMHAVRAGDIVGEHSILFGGDGESIEISHRALSREIFARGALRAALFLSGKSTGLYSMQDVLNLN